jgi:site-specific DNA-methyltransferase (adenine-specific)
MKTRIENADCMAVMAEYPDKYFDLAVVDPPYGIGHSVTAGKQSGTKYGNSAAAKRHYATKYWDNNIPNNTYFSELMRVSKNQIIWGANYMTTYLPPSMGWIFWDKDNGDNGFSDGELAYTSFDKGLRKVKITWNGMIQYNMKNKEQRFHPTQKPIALYKWILQHYAKPEFKILDTHLGSASSLIAADIFGISEFVGTEIDKEYFDAAIERYNIHKSQLTIQF